MGGSARLDVGNSCATNLGIVLGVPRVQSDRRIEVQLRGDSPIHIDGCYDVVKGRYDPAVLRFCSIASGVDAADASATGCGIVIQVTTGPSGRIVLSN